LKKEETALEPWIYICTINQRWEIDGDLLAFFGPHA
jgi:hypothetical protein